MSPKVENKIVTVGPACNCNIDAECFTTRRMAGDESKFLSFSFFFFFFFFFGECSSHIVFRICASYQTESIYMIYILFIVFCKSIVQQ